LARAGNRPESDTSRRLPQEQLAEGLRNLGRIADALETIAEAVTRRSREYLDPDDVAREMKVSPDTARRLMVSGDIRSARVSTNHGTGKRAMFRTKREWVEEYVARNGQAQPAGRPAPRPRRRQQNGGPGEIDFVG
jgi:hypothetical protein